MRLPAETASECSFVDRELDRQFSEKSALDSERLRRHLAECDRCRQLYRWMLEPPTDAEPPPDSYSHILHSLKSSARPVRALPSSARLVLQLWAVFLSLAALALTMVGIAGLGQMAPTQMFGMSAILLIGTALLSLSVVWQMIPGSLLRYPTNIIPATLAALFGLGIVLLFPWRAPEAFLARGWHCLGTGFLMSGLAAVMFWLFARRGAMLGIGAMGATLGACAGLVSVTVLQFACSHQDIGHLLVWHGAVLAGSIAAGVGVAYGLYMSRAH
jgi:hypothetical protein